MRGILARAPFLAGALLLSGCVTLMAPYDDKIDEMATALQREIATEVQTLSAAEKPDCLYPNHAAFYKKARVDISALDVRARAHELNQQTINQIDALADSVTVLEKLHQHATGNNRCMQANEFSDIQRGFDSITTAIVKLELAKKRGK
jgi:outer membrane murein-binding lipoprotein Lpp